MHMGPNNFRVGLCPGYMDLIPYGPHHGYQGKLPKSKFAHLDFGGTAQV